MKIRLGFVSNSSSSSFVAYGMVMSCYEFDKKILVEVKKKSQKHGLQDYIEEKFGDDFRLADDGDFYYFGRSVESLKDDETGAQFKEKAREMIKSIIKIKEKDKLDYVIREIFN